ncbi:hypothetical protein GWI33_014694 [Rhynchophorus ferrugineus]|uniref:Uncharacterized protein n=1 Tax=Rhynchophorus ferrugineus TaxID=354439 RepID=A0A834MC41_RHYFE|nr:hypothetical protein GWI33_014694 [Rhynchophorus ferrugineus]
MYGQHPDLQEEAKLEAMQRVWQGKRNSSTTAFFQEVNETEDILTVSSRQNSWSNACLPPPQKATCSEFENDPELLDVPGSTSCLRTTPKFQQSFLKLDASTIGDLPAHYVICALQPHQLPVCGVYVDKRVVPGFKYRVRPLPVLGQESKQLKCLFQDRALVLQSIGRGFARRFTFEADNGQLNSNDNYFYSDNRPEGYAFELEVISEGDKFTIFDINREAQGTMEVLKIEGAQLEISSTLTKQGIEKRANVKFIGKVEFYDTGVAKPMTLNGTVVALKSKGREQLQEGYS